MAVLVKGLVQVAVGLLGLVQQRWPSTSNLATAATRAVNSSASAWRIWSAGCSVRCHWACCARAAAELQAGGVGRRAAVMAALASAALFCFGAPLLAWLPVVVLGGIMPTVAWALVDP